MNSRLFKKFFLTNAAIFLVGITFLSTILGFVVINYLVNDKKDTLNENCRVVAEIAKNNDSLNESLAEVIYALASTSDIEIFVADQSGAVMACSCDEYKEKGTCQMSRTLISSKIMSAAKEGAFFESGNLDGFHNDNHFTAARTVKYNNGAEIVIFSASPSSQPMTFFKSLIKIYLFAAIVPILIMLVAGYLMSYRLMRPLRQMSDAAKRMAKGDFSRRIPVVSDDEIGELSISFNNMTNSLAQLEGMRRSFVANVSHELRTPMTTIGGFIDAILDGTIDGDTQKHYLMIVSEEIKRLSRLVESMLCLAKLESGEQKINPQVFDIVKATRNIVVSQDRRISDKNIKIKGLEDDGITVNADYDLIYQVIFNLTDNAIKFTNDGGIIEFIIQKEGGKVTFAVRNTGSYIERADIKYIFDRFYKADKSRSVNKNGTGLGLYISKTIIDIHGGTISADSRAGEYTEFCFSLIEHTDKEKENGRAKH
ncbi:MAG: HAMP domain-containing histidine kinase [Clostridia bacterium]|nr:HAMP domain-containing histidine kinase [Clostridia bacterium]